MKVFVTRDIFTCRCHITFGVVVNHFGRTRTEEKRPIYQLMLHHLQEMNSKDSWTEEEKKYHVLAEQKRRHGERLAKEECEAKMIQDKSLFNGIKTKQVFELTKEKTKKQEESRLDKETKYHAVGRENRLKFLDEQERRLASIYKKEEEKKAILAEEVKQQEAVAQNEFAKLQELENQKLDEGEKSKIDKEGRALLFHVEGQKEEEKNALLESERRVQEQKHQTQEKEKKEKIEMEKAAEEIENRMKTALLVKEHEQEFAKMIDETHQAKTRDEAQKCKRWEEEKVNEDLEMEERIKTRTALQKQKLLEYERAREEAEDDAKAIETNVLKMSKEYKEKRVGQIDIDSFHEKEKRKKEEGAKKREKVEEQREKIDSKKLEMEKVALAMEKEKRREVVLKQEEELIRLEEELKKGDDERTRRELEKMEEIQKQIDEEEKQVSNILERQKIRNQEQDSKKEAIAKETESFVAVQANKRKNLEESKREVEKIVSLHDEYLKKEENAKRIKEQERLEKEKQRMKSENEKVEVEISKLLEMQKKKKMDQERLKQENETSLHEKQAQRENKDRKTQVEVTTFSDERERDEERLRLEASRRRELQIKLQQEEILKQQDAEMELLMKSRKLKESSVVGDEQPRPKAKGERKGFFGGLFQKRSPKE